ncbi:MAG: hypothetical protein CMF69_07845 [Magnetovibrio sp.]|nr:hypothetical protein [Magnetovibrio sp.]
MIFNKFLPALMAFSIFTSALTLIAPISLAQQQTRQGDQKSSDGSTGVVRIRNLFGTEIVNQSNREKDKNDISSTKRGAEMLIDLREEMRKFVQSISVFARSNNPNFAIVVKDGLELLVKRDIIDETRISPARTYMRSLDGILAEGLFDNNGTNSKQNLSDRQRRLLSRADTAHKNGIKVFTLDIGEGRATIDNVFARASTYGYVSLVSSNPFTDISSLPTYPKRPFNENPNSVIALDQVKNFIVISNSQPFGREDQFTLALHGNNYDMVVVDVFHNRMPLSHRAIETLKYKKIGTKRLVLAMMDLGAAASYAYYWKNNWRQGYPEWLDMPLRGDPDRFNVKYWHPGWQQIINGDNNSYIYGLIAQGFDGVVISGVEAFKFFEAGGQEETD